MVLVLFFLIRGHTGLLMGENAANKGSSKTNERWRTYFFLSSTFLFLQPHINSAKHYLGQIFNFYPELKVILFSKKKLIK